MEPHGTTVGQKYTKEPREKNLLQRKWVSEPSAGTKRSTFADPDVKRHSHREQSLTSGTSLASSTHKFSSGKLLSSPQSSQESQFQQVYSLPYSYQLPHSYTQEPFLGSTKPQPGLESHAWSFSGQLPSLPPDDMFSVHSHSHGVFPRQKSPAAFGQFPQSGPEQPDESHKKEQKPKKPGKYICHYCGRACAKPSVLKKHIRSHTGERPYPCVPCGFSFKTKSNLYKHRKSHAHAIKAGLVPFSEITTRTDTDQASSVGEAEAHSDGEQSTDTDEETAEGAMFPEKHSPQISFESDKRPLERGPAYGDPAEELSVASMKVPILIVPKQGVPSTATEGPQFTEIKGSFIGGQMDRGDESHTVKQILTLRLTEKKDQDSEQSQNLLSPHSKGSTDSGYFSRSESAEQQISPPNTNAKSYEEIMFGRTWYHRTNSRIRQSVTVKMATFANQDTNININKSSVMQELAMGKISEGRVFYQSDCAESQLVAGCDPKQYHSGSCQTNAGLLEAPSDSGTLIRSNSMPTPSPTNLNVPPSLRGSHSFDEMMTQDDVFYTAGLKRLQRQGAFEHSAQEGHGDSENYGKITGPNSSFKMGERGPVMPEFKCGTKEFATRKRRLKKSVGEEEDCLEQDDGSQGGSIEIPGDYEQRQGSQDSSKAAPANKGSMFRAHSPSDSFDRGQCITPEDVVLVQDSDTKTAGNVISVIQHTNSLSRPNSFEKTESIEHPFYQSDKPAGHHSEQSDSEIIDEVHIPNSHHRSESIKHQQQGDSEHGSFSSNFLYHMPHKLVRQPNIQVPEIRVTEEPDKPEKETEVQVKEPEKHVEEFQWPQRSETLSQLPSEKLPPKKKRLRLADMEHSSGESSFESTCTSLSRSPSQESNLSHSSSFSMSFDREESIKSMSPTKQDDFGKQSEFLTVPGSGHSLSIPGHHQREMRRSSSEQAPCALPTEVPEIRSKSFDYGSLSTGSRQGEVYASSSAMKERRRGYLVRQASLSVYPEVVVQETNSELNIKQEHSDHNSQAATSYCVTSDLARPRRAQPVLGSHHLQQQSISEDSLSEDNFQKTSRLPAQLSSDSEHSMHEHMSQDLIQHSSLQNTLTSSPFLPFQSMLWHPESTQRHKHPLAFQTHQLQKQHIKQPNLQPMLHKPHQPPYQIQVQTDSKTDGASHNNPYPLRTSPQQLGVLSSKVLSTNFLQQLQPVFATQNAGPQPALPEMLVPVRIQTNMPSYGSVMYTSVSQILVTHAQSTTSIRVICSDNASTASLTSTPSKHQVGINLTKMLGHSGGSLHFPIWKVPEYLHGTLNTGIPLSLTSGTISSTDASSSIGGSKRMLSPASSLELFIETKQQKRVKEEKMYGQIVEELSAVELSNSNAPKDDDISHKNEFSKRGCSEDEQERMSLSPPTDFLSSKLLGYSPYLPDVPPKDSFIPPLQIITNVANRADSPEELDIDESTPEASSSPQSVISSDTQEESNQTKFPVNMLAKLAANQGGGVLGSTLVLTDLADVHQFFQFPSLCTPTSVSWCFLNYTKPNYAQTTPLTSVYGSWCVSSYNPNPLNLSTKATLALLRSKQRKNTEMYTMASVYQPGTGKLVSSLRWKQKFEQLKPALIQLEVGKFGKKIKGICSRDRGKEDHGEKEASSKQAEPTRIKIFDGGYKSNEDYVYVRGRGRGKYICEECGIRCKKPSMLKKHIRTHTDVRPYVCKFCNFAFKTKGNLTKHMKSKAHMKKCLELGVSVTSVDEGDAEEQDTTEEGHRASEMIGMSEIMAEHQFSDADDSEGAEEDGDDVDEDEDDDDEYDGDSTPKTQSRSTSPQPCAIPSLSITAVAASQESIPEHLGPPCKLPLSTYFTSLPSIQITQLMAPSEKAGDAQMAKYQKLLQGALGEDHKNRLDEVLALSPEHSSSSFDFSPSHLSSPGCDSSPLRESSPSSRRYLSPRRDLSPRGRLSTRRELSPLRHISPRRDVYRRDLSQRRDLSPRGHLSPISQTGRPTSPGRDLSGRLSPRCRNRGMIRPMSPRRGLPYQSGSWAPSPSPHAELMSLSQKTKSHLELEIDQRKTPHLQGDARNTDAPSIHQGLFSHLPLHSQQQIHHSTPFSMIPIGGIQMVHSVPTSVTVLAHPTRLLLQTSTSEESSTSEVSFHLSEGRWGSSRGPEDSPQSQEKSVSPKAPSPYSQKSREDSADMPNKESKQEECIQTCTKAIASLCIASEETPEKSLVPIDPFHQHTLSHSPTAQQESAPTRAQHYCSSEITHPLHSRAESSMSATSKTPTANHPALYNTEAAEKASGQQGHGERPTTIKKGKDLKDTINNR